MNHSNTLWIGIDPGITGAIAFLCAEDCPHVYDPPTLAVPTAGRKRRVLIEHEMASIIRERILGKRALAWIEWAQAMPGQGVTSMFAYGQGFGTWLGILAALGVPFTKIRPQTWKAAMLRDHGGRDKNTAIRVAGQLWPDVDLGSRSDAGRAEALLLAEYGRRMAR